MGRRTFVSSMYGDIGEAYSLHWRDCELIKLNDPDHTEAVHMKVLGKALFSSTGSAEAKSGQ